MTQSSPRSGGGIKIIAANPKASHDYFFDEVVEAGIVLTGTEIKSIRNQAPNIKDAHVEIRARSRTKNQNSKSPSPPRLEAFLLNAHIAPYSHGNIWNHDPLRARKLLLHRHQIEKMFGAVIQEGKTLIPTKLYFKKGMAKIEVALARGKKKYDKRDTLKEKSASREMDRALKRTR